MSKKNELDFALYRHAVRRLMTQLADYPAGLRDGVLQGTRNVVQLLARKRSNQPISDFPAKINRPQFSNFLIQRICGEDAHFFSVCIG